MEPRYGSVGHSVAGVEVRLIGDDGDDVLVGDTGEIWVHGPNVFQGYYREPEATARVLDADGWLHTGDLATVDDDGWLYLVDRSKDLIIVSGFNVYPAEVEDVLANHPAVVEVGVIGVAHPHTGEAVKAFVVLAPGAAARRGDADRVRERLPRPLQVPDQGHLRRRTAAQRERQAAAPSPRQLGRHLGGHHGERAWSSIPSTDHHTPSCLLHPKPRPV